MDPTHFWFNLSLPQIHHWLICVCYLWGRGGGVIGPIKRETGKSLQQPERRRQMTLFCVEFEQMNICLTFVQLLSQLSTSLAQKSRIICQTCFSYATACFCVINNVKLECACISHFPCESEIWWLFWGTLLVNSKVQVVEIVYSCKKMKHWLLDSMSWIMHKQANSKDTSTTGPQEMLQ